MEVVKGCVGGDPHTGDPRMSSGILSGWTQVSDQHPGNGVKALQMCMPKLFELHERVMGTTL